MAEQLHRMDQLPQLLQAGCFHNHISNSEQSYKFVCNFVFARQYSESLEKYLSRFDNFCHGDRHTNSNRGVHVAILSHLAMAYWIEHL